MPAPHGGGAAVRQTPASPIRQWARPPARAGAHRCPIALRPGLWIGSACRIMTMRSSVRSRSSVKRRAGRPDGRGAGRKGRTVTRARQPASCSGNRPCADRQSASLARGRGKGTAAGNRRNDPCNRLAGRIRRTRRVAPGVSKADLFAARQLTARGSPDQGQPVWRSEGRWRSLRASRRAWGPAARRPARWPRGQRGGHPGSPCAGWWTGWWAG